jgi:phospholipid/cholesterol/gamma-HCH transport system permease protein
MSTAPRLHVESGEIVLAGEWTLAALLPELAAVQAALAAAPRDAAWNLSQVERLDSAAAAFLWRAWGNAWPARLNVAPLQRQALERMAAQAAEMPVVTAKALHPLGIPAVLFVKVLREVAGVVTLFGRLLLDLALLSRHPADIPWREFSANVYKAGAKALPVTALVGFLIGVTISYLSALQLKSFGADLFIVNILGISIIRELGPVLVAVLVAGRSGSAMTAQIGVMRVTEEIDALSTMGISRTIRVVLPKVAGLTAAMPLLVVWTSAVALLGGILAAMLQLDLSFGYFVDSLPRAVPVANLFIGLAKGLVFGFLIALVACHFGLRIKPNTESLAANTTTSVVTAITLVILADAVFAILTRSVGVP